MRVQPLVSIFCVTYNHEKYIAQAIESFLMQKTTFPIEIIIGEDCSTDKTKDICIQYKNKYPDKISLIISEQNIGPARNFLRTLDTARGKYVAYCEGDDYWIDSLKLQKQVDFLEKHEDFSISSHNVQVLNELKPGKITEWLGKNHPEIINLEYLLRYGSGGASCSLVWRNKVFGEFPNWYKEQKGGDWLLQILCAQKGKMKYFKDVMGVYRRHRKGSLFYTTIRARNEKEDCFALQAKYGIEQGKVINEYFSYKYDKLLQKQNIYWYKYYIKEYFKNGNLLMAAKYIIIAIRAYLN